ncbi:MAG: hypothetical protein DME26_06115 [Verrucomicrobia bacterium]|nr:MAG: hypothetical protein DME26_06115 [Verrucomicrobiota bacterium]
MNLRKTFSTERDGIRCEAYDFDAQPAIRLRLYLLQQAKLEQPERIVLSVLGSASRASADRAAGAPPNDRMEFAFLDWENWLAAAQIGFGWELREELGLTPLAARLEQNGARRFAEWQQMLQTNQSVMACFAPRGLGLTVWGVNEAKRAHIRRRFTLLGQTLDGMRVWDVRRAIQSLSTIQPQRAAPLVLQGKGDMAGVALYASLFESRVTDLHLYGLPKSHTDGPELLNVMRVLDMPQAVAMAAERCRLILYESPSDAWEFPLAVASRLDWRQTEIQIMPAD